MVVGGSTVSLPLSPPRKKMLLHAKHFWVENPSSTWETCHHHNLFSFILQKPKPQLKQRRLSSKKNSLAGQSEMSSDGSNSSRKENVPPELMICIDMNTGGEDSAGSDHRTYSRGRSRGRNGSVDPSNWRSYEDPGTSSDQESAIPKFEVDPTVPLETMVALGDPSSDHSESDGGGGGKWRCVSTVDIGPEG